MSETAKLELEGKTYELPVVRGTEDEKAIDITKLRAQSGFITLDNGYMNTGACTSTITYIDGEKGILRYRGYPIEQLAEKSNFMEVSYLLIHGKLPTPTELNQLREKVASHASLPEGLLKMLDHFPKDAHPMGVLSAATVALGSFYPEYQSENLTEEQINEVSYLLMAKLKMVAAAFYRKTQGLPLVPSEPKRGFCNDFLNMMFRDDQGTDVDDDVAKALNALFILHADHEQNCSTSAVRLVGSSKANPFATIAAGIDALWGPLHGGANQAVLEMLEMIHQDGGDYKKYIERAKNKEDSFRLMGFGHRVYKNFDPRSRIIKQLADFVLSRLGVKDPLLGLAKGLAQEALQDPYFVERKLYPNVDFYSGIIYRAIGIPVNMFIVMFALGRLPGWLAQWKEMCLDRETKINRPRQIYVGEPLRDYVPLDQR